MTNCIILYIICCFSVGGIPPDSTEMEVTSPISNVVIAVVYIGSGVGVVIAIICLCFNIIFRNRKYVVYSLLSLF